MTSTTATCHRRQHWKTYRRKVDTNAFANTVEANKLRGSYIDPNAGKAQRRRSDPQGASSSCSASGGGRDERGVLDASNPPSQGTPFRRHGKAWRVAVPPLSRDDPPAHQAPESIPNPP